MMQQIKFLQIRIRIYYEYTENGEVNLFRIIFNILIPINILN